VEFLNARQARNRRYSEIHIAAEREGNDQLKLVMRQLSKTDLFYLLTVTLARKDINRDWLFDRCNEVQDQPDGYLDLWAREHYKSTIITFGLTIQDILRDPEITIGIFSHTKPIAKSFLRQIKNELETNERLKYLFSEIFYSDPKSQAPTWSEDKGITVIRKGNPNAATVEAWGLVDGQPTSKHYQLCVYDDVVTEKSVSTPEMIQKVTNSWALSLNLGAQGGCVRYIGTRYHFNDTYAEIMRRETATPRIHPATDDGKPTGEPVFLTREQLDKKRRDQGPYIFACQQLQDPKADNVQGFVLSWLRFLRHGHRHDRDEHLHRR